MSELFLGIDLGTGGVRVLAVRGDGQVIASHSVAFDKRESKLPAGWHEQDAQDWWQVAKQAIAGVVEQLKTQGQSLDAIKALAVDGTSGTVVGLDEAGEPVRPAMMYNDGRAVEEAKELAALAAREPQSPSGTIAASYAIAKVRWLATHETEAVHKVRCFVHQADYIVGKLTGERAVTDYSNALKMGFDLVTGTWPAWLGGLPGICERLPKVVAPGSYIASLREEVARELGLPAKVQVIAGATDGTAGFLASGARHIGDDNTTLGTTLVFKRLSDKPVFDPRGLIYCHKLPGAGEAKEMWLPGAASNTGCEWMNAIKDNVKKFDADAEGRLPCDVLAYPLARAGERFPILAPQAQGFIERDVDHETEYAAKLQGVALVERLCYEALDAATGAVGKDVYATGGGSHSDIWMQLRADVTGRVYHRPSVPESAFGAAVLAAAGSHHPDLPAAIGAMVRIDRTFEPDNSRRAKYDELFTRFKSLLRERLEA